MLVKLIKISITVFMYIQTTIFIINSFKVDFLNGHKMTERRQRTRESNRDNVDYSSQSLTEFPQISRENLVINFNLSNNMIKKFPSLSNFTNVRRLNISCNKFTDLTPLSAMSALDELDCSYNSVTNIDFIGDLKKLRSLNASHNNIKKVNCKFPEDLFKLDLSFNQFTSLDFLESVNPEKIENLYLEGNQVNEIISLKFIAVLKVLRILTTGLLDKNPGIKLLSFVKFLCPSLQFFDEADCSDAFNDSGEWSDQEILNIFLNGTDEDLRRVLCQNNMQVLWEDPEFIAYDVDPEDDSPLFNSKFLSHVERRLIRFEDRITEIENNTPEVDKSISQIRREMSEMKEQMDKLVRILFAHDKALEKIWNQVLDK